MMKKLLILLLVMSVATTANAALTLVSSAGNTLDPTGVLNPNITMIGINNDVAAAGQGKTTYVTINGADPANWTGVGNVHVPPALGGANTYYGVIDFGAGPVDTWESALGVPSTSDYGIGVLADFEFMCTGVGDVTVTLLADDTVTVLDSITISQVIPEPITFGLLGLGGLFLRRRK